MASYHPQCGQRGWLAGAGVGTGVGTYQSSGCRNPSSPGMYGPRTGMVEVEGEKSLSCNTWLKELVDKHAQKSSLLVNVLSVFCLIYE